MNLGRYVFAQVADFIPRYEFDRIVRKYNGDYHVRELSCYNLFLHLMFGQLTACESRAVERSAKVQKNVIKSHFD